jgi:hypothetical protein
MFRRISPTTWGSLRMLYDGINTPLSWCRDHLFAINFVVLLIFAAVANTYIALFPASHRGIRWDPMMISGFLAYLVGLNFALKLDDKVQFTIHRLIASGVLAKESKANRPDEVLLSSHDAKHLSEAGKELNSELVRKLNGKVAQSAQRGGLIVAAVVAALFTPHLLRFGLTALFFLEVVLGYCAGRYLGRMVMYGHLNSFLKHENVQVRMHPLHPDGVAGLRPIGEFYFYQAAIAGIPGIYLGSWIIVMSIWGTVYYDWLVPYLLFLAIVAAIFNLAFLAPLFSFHKTMLAQKKTFLDSADLTSQQIVRERLRLVSDISDEEKEDIKERLAESLSYYDRLQEMPVWPVSTKIRTKFTLSNLVLSLPIANFFVYQENPTQAIGGFLDSLVKYLASSLSA